MKNLKRVLSLGLASVMLLGMMVVGASAKDFTDSEDIEHTEAVETMVALNIIKGKEDGSYFDPKGTVTRGEMAKMIAVAMNAGNEEAAGVKTVPTFTDISTHWAQPWIEYCADMKIISGRGDGTFDPEGKVTGTEAAKMVLSALGYDAKAYDLEGATWATSTNELAKTTKGCKLIEDLENVVMNQPATRDVAAQMIWNGLQAYVVTVTPEQNKNNGEVTWGYNTDTGVTLLNQRYGANVITGIFEGNHNYGATGALKGEIKVTEYKMNDKNESEAVKSHTFPSNLSIDNIGEEVKVVWKDGAKGIKGQADAKDTIYGVFNTGATRVVRSQLSKVKDNDTGKAILNIDGTKYDAKETVDVIYNFTDSKKTTGDNALNSKTKKDAAGLAQALKVNSGYPIKVVFDDVDNKVSAVYVTESWIAAVSAVNSTNITLNNGIGSLKIEDHDIEEGLEKGDVVVVTALYGNELKAPVNSDAVVTVKKADKVSGELTGFKLDESVTVGGKTYKINYQNDSTISQRKLLDKIPGLDDDSVVIPKFKGTGNDYINEDVDLYLVNGYVMAAVKTSEGASNYSVITEVKETKNTSSVFGGLQLQVMGADGTKEIITVSKDSIESTKYPTHDSSKGISSADYSVGDIITYTFNDDDEAEVKIIERADSNVKVSYNEKSKSVTAAGKSAVASADCVLFVQTGTSANFTGLSLNKGILNVGDADWEAYDIRELDDIAEVTAAAAVAKNDDGKVVAVFINLQRTPDGATDNTVYGIVSAENGTIKDYDTFIVQCNGEEYTVNLKPGDTKLAKGMLVKFRPTTDNNYANNKVTIVKADMFDPEKDTAEYKVGYVKEYSSRDNTLTFFGKTVADEKDENGKTVSWKGDKATEQTYALDKDCIIVYVNLKDSNSTAEASIDAFSAINNKPNVALITKQVGEDTVIDILFVETTGEKHVNDKNK